MKKTEEKDTGRRKASLASSNAQRVDRKLVGIRIEPRLVKVMKAISELHDCALGELIEQVFWASMNGGNFFAEKGKISAETRNRLESLKSVYGVDYGLDFLASNASKSAGKNK
jgi:hypothetical protein